MIKENNDGTYEWINVECCTPERICRECSYHIECNKDLFDIVELATLIDRIVVEK